MPKFISAYRNNARRINESIVSIVTALALGIVANGIYSLLLWGVSHFVQLTVTSLLPWGAVTSIVIFLNTGGLFYFWRKSRKSASRYNETQKILEMDERIYERLVITHKEVKSSLVDLLQYAVDEMFGGKVMRAFILVPNIQRTHLIPWVHYKMPSDGLDEMSFYVGNEPHHQHGVAGTAFVSQSIEVAHIKIKACHLECDHDQFVVFDEKKSPRYRAIICIPILSAVTKNTVKCIGVACFDSSDRELFDGQETQQILKSVVKRIAEVIRIYGNIGSLSGDDFPPAA